MKDRDIKKLLADEAENILPDESIKENIKYKLGYDAGQEAKAIAGGGTESAKINRRTLIAICAAALAIIIALSIILPTTLGGKPSFPSISGGENKFEEITDAQSFYAYGAASLGSILSSPDGEGGATTAASPLTDDGDANERLGAINRYMPLVESLLSDGAISGTVETDKYGYECAMTVTHTDLLGNAVTYVMYYNRTFTGGESEDGESEENYSIEGVLVIGDESYPVEGTYKTESELDGDESEFESELEFRAFTSSDRRSYIEVRQEHESETEDGESELETEYVYRVYEGGKLVSTTEIQYEQEDGEPEIFMSVEQGGQRDELTFTAPRGNGNTIFARGTISGEQVSFTVHISEGSYRYEFSDGRNESFGRAEENKGNRPQSATAEI